MVNREKLPPHDDTAEEATIGSVLIEPEVIYNLEWLESEDFFNPKCRIIFQVFKNMAKNRRLIDQISIAQELNSLERLEPAGGPAYLAHLVSIVPTSLHAEHYGRIVQRLATSRKIIETAGKIAQLGYEAGPDIKETIQKASQLIHSINLVDINEIITPAQYAETLFHMLTARKESKGESIPYGYIDLDKHLAGIFPGEMIIIGARPRTGKTQMLFEVALRAVAKGKTVLFASAEMPIQALGERHLNMDAGIEIKDLRHGNLEEDEWERAFKVLDSVKSSGLYFMRTKRMTSTKIAQLTAKLNRDVGIDLLIVDYLQILNDSGYQNDNVRVSNISKNLKNIAVDENIGVVVASQLNRASAGRQNKLPTLEDLRDSGSIEQDADIVLLLYRPEVEDKTKEPGILHIKIAKARQIGEANGAKIKLLWNHEMHGYVDICEGSY